MIYPEEGDLFTAASDPLTDPAVLSKIFAEEDPHEELLEALVRNPEIDQKILVFGALHGSVTVQCVVLMHPKASLSLIKIVLGSILSRRVSDVEAQIENLNSIPELYTFLVTEIASKTTFVYSHVLTSLLRNPSVPALFINEQLNKLDAFKYIIPDIFEDSRVSEALLINAACSQNIDKRVAVANNESLPSSLLLVLARDSAVEVLGAAKRNLNFPIERTAAMHIAAYDSYTWRPSYLIKLESKADEFLSNMGMPSNDLEGIPLSWKLRMIAE